MHGERRGWRMPGRRRHRPEHRPTARDVQLPFDAETTRVDGRVVWAISGEIDIATAPHLRAKLQSGVAAGDKVLVDLTDVAFMDSTGLGLLLEFDREIQSAGARWAIVCPEGPARLLFAVSGAESSLPLHSTRAEAEGALG